MNEAFVTNEEQPGLEEPKPHHSFLPTLKRWLREPLLHFLLLGIYSYMNRGRMGIEPSKQIAVTLDDLRVMETYA